MNREDIIAMAREVWGTPNWNEPQIERLERFATLVTAAENEACAKVCDAEQQRNEDDGAFMWEAKNCAAAIRARRNT